MKTKQQRIIIEKFEIMSMNSHKLSLLLNELAGSLRIKAKELGEGNVKGFKAYLKELNIDIEKLKGISLNDLSLSAIKKEETKWA